MMKRGWVLISFAAILQSFCLCFCCFISSFAQDTVGSLKNSINPCDSAYVVELKLLCWENRNKDVAVALHFGNLALGLAQKCKMPYEEADILTRIGIVKRNQSRFSEALEYYIKALEISKKHGFLKLQGYCYNNIADIYNRLGLYDKALEYAKVGLETLCQVDEKNALGYVFNIKGLIYKNMGILDSAYSVFSKSLAIRKEINFQEGVATSFLNIGSIYFLKEEYDSSIYYYQKAVEIYSLKNDQFGLANAFRHLGSYFLIQKDYLGAINYFEQSLEFNKGFGNIELQMEAAEGLRDSYYALGRISKAYNFQKLTSKLKDSINTTIFIERITHLTENFKYELRRKEEEQIQKENETLLSNRIRNQQILIRFYISIIFLVIMLAVIGVYLYYLKNRSYLLLNRQKREIEELNSTKDKLFSLIGHDLKNPIHSIMGISELLRDHFETFDKKQMLELVSSVYDAGRATHEILENLLSWARAQTDKIQLNIEELSIDKLIDHVVSGVRPGANRKEIQIFWHLDADFVVEADANIVSTTLRNLLSNAVKYSRRNSQIVISVTDRNSFLEISVKDEGVGMSPEVKEKLFSSININPGYGTENEKGTGLGLSISKGFITKLGGDIWFESEQDVGSTFHFSIPKRFTK